MSKLSIETRLRVEALHAATLVPSEDVLEMAEQYFDWLRQEARVVTQTDVLRAIKAVGDLEPWSGDNTYGEGVEDAGAAVRALYTEMPAESRFKAPDSTMPCGKRLEVSVPTGLDEPDAEPLMCDLSTGHVGAHSGGGFRWGGGV